MKIRIINESMDEYYEARISDDSCYDDVCVAVDNLLVSYGFDQETVKRSRCADECWAREDEENEED